MKDQAELWRPLSPDRVQCLLCRHFCRLQAGEWGKCGVRGCTGDEKGQLRLITLVGRHAAALHVDPIEKKPLYHYLPGSRTLSLGTFGCNFDCAWCQNSDLSRPALLTSSDTPQEERRAFCRQGYVIDAEEVVQLAQERACASIAFTYNEPTVFFEMMRDCADRARRAGLGTVLVSNGYQSPACLHALGGLIEAANIDVKGFSDRAYRHFCGGTLAGVLDNLVLMRRLGWWLEITTLIIPGINDSEEETEAVARFILDKLGAETPWHLSAFFPRRRLSDRPVTSAQSLLRIRDRALSMGLRYVYTGNVAGQENPTLCPRCHEVLVRRPAATALSRMEKGQCPACGNRAAGIWTSPHHLALDGGKR